MHSSRGRRGGSCPGYDRQRYGSAPGVSRNNRGRGRYGQSHFREDSRDDVDGSRRRQHSAMSGDHERGIRRGGLFSTRGSMHDERESRQHSGHRGRGPYGFRDRGGSNGRREKQTDLPKVLGFGRLKQWAELEDAGDLVLFMSSERQQLETFLNQSTIKEDWFTLLVTAICHAITAQHQKESIKQLLEVLHTTRFFDHLAAQIARRQTLEWSEAANYCKAVINILEEMLNRLPGCALKCITASSQLLDYAASLNKVFQEDKDLLDSLTSLSQRSTEVYKSESEREKGSDRKRFFRAYDTEKPPDNFMELPVVPTEFDLKEDAKPFVRGAKIEGAYEDTHHYLDVQFRLMRQDFILPLRQGILEFKKSGCKKNFDCSDLRLYFDVRIIGTVFKDGIDHVLSFDVSKLKNVKWEFSKRLMFASLVCLSKDNFKTVVFATVAHRDAKELANGTVSVNFKSGLDVVFNSTPKDEYIMAETTAYFESYCHVLEGLQEMSSKLPLQDYIVKCKKELKPPRYLLPSGGVSCLPVYDLSCLMKDESTCEVPVLTTVKWPGAEVMSLNESQREAAQLALTKEMAIIQGPPGTGKTYVGLKILQVLMENKKAMGGNEQKSTDPVLVVCYTNHALDQFLEGVLEFCPTGIVRVGGKDKSEKLEKFTLKNLKQKIRRERLFPNVSVRRSTYDCVQELKEVSENIEKTNKLMEALETDIQTERVLKSYMKNAHLIHFTTTAQRNMFGKHR